MTDEQVLTAAIAVVFPVAALIYSNSRITDVKETLRAEMQTFRAEIQLLRAEIRHGFEDIKTQLELHVVDHHHS